MVNARGDLLVKAAAEKRRRRCEHHDPPTLQIPFQDARLGQKVTRARRGHALNPVSAGISQEAHLIQHKMAWF